MENTKIHHPLTRTLVAALLALAPSATILWVATLSRTPWLGGDNLEPALILAVLLWSPLPFSIPAMLLQNHRDRFEPGGRGFGRGVRMLRYLISSCSPCRAEQLAAILGWIVAVVTATTISVLLPF